MIQKYKKIFSTDHNTVVSLFAAGEDSPEAILRLLSIAAKLRIKEAYSCQRQLNIDICFTIKKIFKLFY